MQSPAVLGGRYELRGVLGRGGMSEVRDAWDRQLHRPVAIKLLYPMFIADPATRHRFENEARAASSLSHPHIVAVFDSGDHEGTPYIVMERLPGPTLADMIVDGPMPQERVAAVVDDVLSALGAAHGAGILHRDIKPANILFTEAGDAKVADFGIAKSDATPHTMTGQIVGTMAYLSPERMAGLPATTADDIYACGVVGYEALTGCRAFPQQSLPELARVISEGRHLPLAVARPDVAPGLAAAIEQAMSPDRRWRFQRAEEMRAALAGGPVSRPPTRVMSAPPLPPPATVVVPPQRRRSRGRTLIGVAAAVAAALIAVAAVVADSASRAPTPEPAGTTATSIPPSIAPQTVLPPPPSPVQVEQGHGPKGRGEGNKPRPKPKHGHGGD